MSESAVPETTTTETIMEESMMEPEQSQLVQAWRVYGIVPADAELPDLSTADDEQDFSDRDLHILRHGRIAAVVEAVDPNRPARRQDLLAHSSVLNALAAEGPVIPVAFGAAFPEHDQVVTEFLAAPGAADALIERLEDLRGCAQFQIRVRYLMDDLLAQIVASDDQIADLSRRTRELSEMQSYNDRVQLGELVTRAVEARQSDDADNLLTQLGAIAKDSVVSSKSTSVPSISLAFLVADSERSKFEAVAEQAAESMHDRAILELLGPLAAFDFVADLVPKR